MGLRLGDKWIWDFWVVEDDGLFHVFYLQAPRSLGDPELRHWNVSIGHAVSVDLIEWSVRPDALAPGPAGSWDDYTTWTGSIIRHEDRWHLFYTGTSRAEQGKVQRIGLAVSDDLDDWERHGPALIEADGRWYERLGGGDWHDEAWRDPWVFRHDDGWFHVFVTARIHRGERFERGCVGHARSSDLLDWDVLPPVSSSDGFGQLEVPQLVSFGDRWHVLFCSDVPTQADTRRSGGTGTGTYYLTAEGPLGPFDAAAARVLQADPNGTSYAGRVIDRGDGLFFLAWLRVDAEGRFVGELGDPVRVLAGEQHALVLEAATT